METSPVPGQVPAPPDGQFDVLVHELYHSVWEVRRDACEELGVRGDRRAIPHLIHMLQDSVGLVRFAAVEALGKLNDRAVTPHLVKLLNNPQFGAYGPVVEALTNLRSTQAIPSFIRLLRDNDARVRSLAANALMVVTRQAIPFKAKGTLEEREASIRHWEVWWEKNRRLFEQGART